MRIQGDWQIHVLDYANPEDDLDPNEFLSVEETNEGPVILPVGCDIVGFQWAPEKKDETGQIIAHLFVYIRQQKRPAVLGTVLWPSGTRPDSYD